MRLPDLNEFEEKLLHIRAELVSQRRALAAHPRFTAEESAKSIKPLQDLIEAVDRAIQDERKQGKGI